MNIIEAIKKRNKDEFLESLQSISTDDYELVENELLRAQDFDFSAKVAYWEFTNRKGFYDELVHDIKVNHHRYDYYAFLWLAREYREDKQIQNFLIAIASRKFKISEYTKFLNDLESFGFSKENITDIKLQLDNFDTRVKAAIYFGSMFINLFSNDEEITDYIIHSNLELEDKIRQLIFLYWGGKIIRNTKQLSGEEQEDQLLTIRQKIKTFFGVLASDYESLGDPLRGAVEEVLSDIKTSEPQKSMNYRYIFYVKTELPKRVAMYN